MCGTSGASACGRIRTHTCTWTSFFHPAHTATRWRESVCGTHVEYDQRPDVFRYDVQVANDTYGICCLSCPHETLCVQRLLCVFASIMHLFSPTLPPPTLPPPTLPPPNTVALFGMPVCMHTWAGQPAAAMTSNPSPTPCCFCSRAVCRGRAIRYEPGVVLVQHCMHMQQHTQCNS